MDMSAIGSLVGSIKTASDIAKFVRESSLSLERAELRMKLADLIEALANAKIEAADIQQEIIDRDKRIRELEVAVSLREALRWDQPCYFLRNQEGTEDPYCQTCYDATGKLSRLHVDGTGCFHCRVCKQSFKTPDRLVSDRAQTETKIAGYRGS